MDILQSLLVDRSALVKRGKVVAINDTTVSVQMKDGILQLPKGVIAVKNGDEVTVQGNQLTGRRMPAKAGRTYRV